MTKAMGQQLRVTVRLKLTTVATINLNADLGGGFGVWRLGDDDAMLGIVTNANDRLKAEGIDVKAVR